MNNKVKKRVFEEALKETKAGMTVTAASKIFSLPRSTLNTKVIRKYKTNKPGPLRILSPSYESKLVEWIFSCTHQIQTITKIQISNTVLMLVNKLRIANPFSDTGPGRTWFTSFLRRHSSVKFLIAEGVSQNLGNKCDLEEWFVTIEKYLREKNLLHIDSSRIFNTDEIVLLLNAKDDRNISKSDKFNKIEKKSVSAFMTGNAAGQLAPLLILFPYEHKSIRRGKKVPEYTYGTFYNSWTKAKSFYEYIVNLFYPWLLKNKIILPVILYVNGHASYLTQQLSEFSCKYKIEIIALQPDTTHVIQPMEVSIFDPLKITWEKEVNKYSKEKRTLIVNESDVGPLLENTLEIIDSTSILKKSFQNCGLHPFSLEVVNKSKISVKDIQTRLSIKYISILRYIEGEINSTILEAFKAASDKNKWTGQKEYESLFYVWKNLTKQVKINNKNFQHRIEEEPAVSETQVDFEAEEETNNISILKELVTDFQMNMLPTINNKIFQYEIEQEPDVNDIEVDFEAKESKSNISIPEELATDFQMNMSPTKCEYLNVNIKEEISMDF